MTLFITLMWLRLTLSPTPKTACEQSNDGTPTVTNHSFMNIDNSLIKKIFIPLDFEHLARASVTMTKTLFYGFS